MTRLAPLLALAPLALILAVAAASPVRAADAVLPPLAGPSEPRVVPERGEDGLYHQTWAVKSFLDLKEDHAEANKAGKRFAVIFEQRGCIYCTKMHTEVLARRYINDYVRENFAILQLDLWGAREVTDFDGTRTTEKRLAERWGVLFTPTIVFFKDDLTGVEGKGGPPLEVARMGLGIGEGTFYDMFVWIRAKVYERDRNFQRFHVERAAAREQAKAKAQ